MLPLTCKNLENGFQDQRLPTFEFLLPPHLPSTQHLCTLKWQTWAPNITMLLQTTTKLATNNLSTVISSIMLRCQRLEVQKLGRYGHTPIFQCHQTYTEEACCQSFGIGSGMPSVSARFFASLSSTRTRYSARGCWLLDIVEVQEHWDYIWYPVASSWLWDIINREGKSSWPLFFITSPLER